MVVTQFPLRGFIRCENGHVAAEIRSDPDRTPYDCLRFTDGRDPSGDGYLAPCRQCGSRLAWPTKEDMVNIMDSLGNRKDRRRAASKDRSRL
jgi:hypothetical protein